MAAAAARADAESGGISMRPVKLFRHGCHSARDTAAPRSVATGCFCATLLEDGSTQADPILSITGATTTWILFRALHTAAALKRAGRELASEAKETQRLRDKMSLQDGPEQAEKLRGELEKWKREAETLRTQVEAIQKQAANQAAEYMRLDTENRSLRSQLADFDILLNGQQKKAS
ncbi:unnamed protein product [Symbiodinium sp. CCMP2592]|nr:unnamed protein product [Symbiodinium sp. CCMP2592]